MVIRPKDLATGEKYMYRGAAKSAAISGFSGVIVELYCEGKIALPSPVENAVLFTTEPIRGSVAANYNFEDSWPRPKGTGATSCQQPSVSRTNINSSTSTCLLPGNSAQRSRAITDAARASSSFSVFTIVRCGV